MRIPPLICPQCKSFRVLKNRCGSIDCEECGQLTAESGKIYKGKEDRAFKIAGGSRRDTKADIKLDKI
jgi:uncharacterized Zn finger protein